MEAGLGVDEGSSRGRIALWDDAQERCREQSSTREEKASGVCSPSNEDSSTVLSGVVQQADAKQAYTQSLLGGKETWVRLPEEVWPEHWKGKYTDPVCPLRLALYGHPDSGGFWEQHCEKHLLEQGFEKIRPWRSCYFHPKLKQFLIVYVDDFKMSGPADTQAEAENRCYQHRLLFYKELEEGFKS